MPQTRVENQFCSLPVTSVNPLNAEKFVISEFQPEEKIFFEGVLKRKKLFKKHHGHNFSPKNQTYYYRLDYEELSLLALEAINSEKLNNAGGEE